MTPPKSGSEDRRPARTATVGAQADETVLPGHLFVEVPQIQSAVGSSLSSAGTNAHAGSVG